MDSHDLDPRDPDPYYLNPFNAWDLSPTVGSPRGPDQFSEYPLSIMQPPYYLGNTPGYHGTVYPEHIPLESQAPPPALDQIQIPPSVDQPSFQSHDQPHPTYFPISRHQTGLVAPSTTDTVDPLLRFPLLPRHDTDSASIYTKLHPPPAVRGPFVPSSREIATAPTVRSLPEQEFTYGPFHLKPNASLAEAEEFEEKFKKFVAKRNEVVAKPNGRGSPEYNRLCGWITIARQDWNAWKSQREGTEASAVEEVPLRIPKTQRLRPHADEQFKDDYEVYFRHLKELEVSCPKSQKYLIHNRVGRARKNLKRWYEAHGSEPPKWPRTTTLQQRTQKRSKKRQS